MVTAEKVSVLGSPVGCLYDIFKDNRHIGRVTYHGDTLIEIKRGIFGNPWDSVTRLQVTCAIRRLYNELADI